MTHLLILDSQKSLQNTLAQMLETEADICSVSCTNSKEESMNILAEAQGDAPVVLMDVHLTQGEPDGLIFARDLREYFPHIKIIMYSFHKVGAYIYYMYRIGVHGYLFKDAKLSQLVEAIRRVKDGQLYYQGAVQKRLEAYKKFLHSKSDRELYVTLPEREFLQQMKEGHSLSEMFSDPDLNLVRMITHWSNITLKFGTQDVAHIISTSVEKGWLS